MKKILISASCSALASNFIRNLLYEGADYRVSSFDMIASKKYMKNVYINKNASFYFADINDSHILSNIIEFEKPDIFLDFAHSPATIELEKNIAKIEKYILVSNYYDEGKRFKEQMDLNNKSVLRLPKLYGPRQFMPSEISSMIFSGVTKKEVKINKNPMQEEYWMHIFDAIKNIKFMLENPGVKELNAFGKQCFNYLEVQQKISKILKQDLPIVYDSTLTNEPRSLRLDTCQQEFSLHDGLDQTIEWCQCNQWVFNET